MSRIYSWVTDSHSTNDENNFDRCIISIYNKKFEKNEDLLLDSKMIIYQTIVRRKMINRTKKARNMISISNNQMNLINIW